MNRRKFLSVLGLAPVAACSAALPAVALPKPNKVKDIIHNAGVDEQQVKLKMRGSDLKDNAEVLFFKDGRILFRAARIDV
jgi:hypothetical protein